MTLLASLAGILSRSAAHGLSRRSVAERVAVTTVGWLSFSGGVASPGRRNRLLFRELHAYQRAFSLFRTAAAPPLDGARPLAAQLHALRLRHGEFDALWAVEGLGLSRAEAGCFPAEEPDLPLAARVPLHAGLGLALGTRLLAADAALESALAEVVTAARARSAPGCAGVAVESLGVLVRCLLPDRLGEVDAALCSSAPELRPTFWHGVGRALVFLFPRLGSGGRWEARQRARREAPDAACGDAAVGGLVWPLLLANLRRPEIVADALQQLPDEPPRVVAQSVLGAALVWQVWAAETDPLLAELVTELASHRETAALADRLVAELDPALEGLRRSAACEELFSLAPPSLLDRLRRRDTPLTGSAGAS